MQRTENNSQDTLEDTDDKSSLELDNDLEFSRILGVIGNLLSQAESALECTDVFEEPEEMQTNHTLNLNSAYLVETT
jgi:hypothetical protein